MNAEAGLYETADENDSEDCLFEVSNVRGSYVKNPHPLPFSFYFSSGLESQQSIRVKPVFDSEVLKKSQTGMLMLCDDWAYIPGANDGNVSTDLIKEMKSFFREYLVLFCAVWDEQMQDAVLQDYFVGNIDFDDMLKDLDFYDRFPHELSGVHDVQELERFCRKNELVNLYGNEEDTIVGPHGLNWREMK